MRQAVKWYRKAADQGHAEAQTHLAGCYEAGKGCDQDYRKAARWYLKAAEQGRSDAQYALGNLYENGRCALFSTLVCFSPPLHLP